MDNYLERDSVVLRYAAQLKAIERPWVERASIAEGVNLIYGKEYKHVHLGLLDLSSYAATGSFKSTVACVTMAACIGLGIKRFVTQSSGNTANALARYAAAANVQVLILYPASSRYKIEPDLSNSSYVQFVEFEGTEDQLKALIQSYSNTTGIPWLPTEDMQVESNKLRAYFLAESETKNSPHFNWHVQSLSSGWGIFGFYQGIEELESKGHFSRPRFFGVQQEAICPFYRYVNSDRQSESVEKIIEPTLFRSNPTPKMLEKMKRIVASSNGKIKKLMNASYALYEPLAVQTISEFGIRLGSVQLENETVFKEKAGIIAVAAVLEDIDLGLISKGDRVLICLTAGGGPDRRNVYVPSKAISGTNGLESLIHIGNEFF